MVEACYFGGWQFFVKGVKLEERLSRKKGEVGRGGVEREMLTSETGRISHQSQ